MENDDKEQEQTAPTTKKYPAVSRVFTDGSVLELIYDPVEKKTRFSLWHDGAYCFVDSYTASNGEILTPYSPSNNLIRNNVVLFPSGVEEYGSDEALIREIQGFIHRYVTVSPRFEKIATYYVLLSWVHDNFHTIPYVRVRGDYGTGKTRFLLTVGALCYKPIFASGASTTAPIFHILDAFGGTYIIDEADFRFSDEKSDMIKILNNGNAKGMPLLRMETTKQGEFNPRAYQIFGPKLVGMRGSFEDRALESRFITEHMDNCTMRDEVLPRLPSELHSEAQVLRNKLLLFRFRNRGKTPLLDGYMDHSLEPRINQIFFPLCAIIKDSKVRDDLKALAREVNQEVVAERRLENAAQALEVLQAALSEPDVGRPSINKITAAFIARFGDQYDRPITPRWIGHLLRSRLGIKTKRVHGVYVIPQSEEPKLKRLYRKYGLDKVNQSKPAQSDDENRDKKQGDIG